MEQNLIKEDEMKLYVLTEEELKNLLYAREKLNTLECSGVDNWEWYGDAIQESECYDDEEGDIVIDKFLEHYDTIDSDIDTESKN